MIDVHILTMPGDRADWFEQCLSSLKDEPVELHVCNGIENDIGNARADAFLLGNSEYVSFVDPDDYVLPGGFAACMDRMKAEGSSAACTYEIKTGESGEVLGRPYVLDWIHHLLVFKRDVVLAHLNIWREWKWPSRTSEGQNFITFLKGHNHKVSLIKKPYYVWRRHYQSYTTTQQMNMAAYHE